MVDNIDSTLFEPSFFERLVDLHVRENVIVGAQYIEDGIMKFADGRTARVGKENGQEWYKGILLIANGTDIIDHLVDAGAVIGPMGCRKVGDAEGLFSVLPDYGTKDNAIIYDRAEGRFTRVRIEKGVESLERVATEAVLPQDFLSEDGTYPFFDEDGCSNVGNRTAVGLIMSRGFHGADGKHHAADAYLLKHTIFSELGFGPVVHFAQNRMDMFFARYAPKSDGPFLVKEKRIVGVHRPYMLVDERFVPDEMNSESVVYLNDQGKLADPSGELVFPGKTLLSEHHNLEYAAEDLKGVPSQIEVQN